MLAIANSKAIPSMSNNDRIFIGDLDELERVSLGKSLRLSFQIGPQQECDATQIIKAMKFTMASHQIEESRFMSQLKTAIANSLGNIDHVPGTTLNAGGEVKLIKVNDVVRFEIELNYEETPELVGSSSGSVTVDISAYSLGLGNDPTGRK